jgi:hypothetical protein
VADVIFQALAVTSSRGDASRAEALYESVLAD